MGLPRVIIAAIGTAIFLCHDIVIATTQTVDIDGEGHTSCPAEELDAKQQFEMQDQKMKQFVKFIKYLFEENNKSIHESADSQARHVLSLLMRHVDMDPNLLGRRLVRNDGNWLQELHERILTLAPDAFFKLYQAPPNDLEYNLLTMNDAYAMKQATTEDGLTDHITLRTYAFTNNRDRGMVPTQSVKFRSAVIHPIQHMVGFAIPNDMALNAISSFAPLVEVGAGTGYWSAILQQRGVDIVAYDAEPPTEQKNNIYFVDTYTDISRGECASLFKEQNREEGGKSLSDRAMLIAWPNNPDTVDNPHIGDDMRHEVWDAECLSAYMSAGGETVIFVGEREDNIEVMPNYPADCGLSATRRFQVMLKDNFRLVDRVEIPTWWAEKDDVTIWKRI